MVKQLLSKTIILLCALVVGNIGIWADTTVTFTFNTDAGIKELGISKPSSGAGTNLSSNSPYTLSGVSMSVTHGSTETREWNSNGTLDLRIYKSGGSLTFSVSEGNVITKIEFAGSTTNVFSVDTSLGTYSNGTWTPKENTSTNSVKFTATNTGKINTITVTYTASQSSTTPSFTASNVNIDYDATGGSIAYTLNNGVEGGSVNASVPSGSWLTLGSDFTSPIAFTCEANTVYTERTETVTLTYTYGYNETVTKEVTVTQAAALQPPTFNVTDQTLQIGGTFTVTDANYTTDGVVTLTNSTNTAVATVDGLTVTALAVGTTTITISAAEGTDYKAGTGTFKVTVAAPEALTTALSPDVTTTFKNKDLEYDGDGIDWTASKEANQLESSGSARGVQFGAAIGDFTLTATNNDAISKVSMVLSTNGTGNTVSVKVGDTDFTTTFGVDEGDDAIKTLTLASGMSKETVEFTGNATGNVVISVNDKNKSVYFKSITLTKASAGPKVTLNGSGYATFCSQYPLDFTNASGYSAWQVTSASSSTITFEQIEGSIKGGQGILLKGEAGATVTLKSADSSNELDSNLLIGTMAPQYVANGSFYGLSGETFVPVNAGTVPAGKALLPASEVSARALTFVFENASDIAQIENDRVNADNSVYNLNGQRVNSPKKGLYIIGGKKVMMK